MTISIDGMDEVREVLSTIAPNIARNLIRSTVRNVAANITKAAKPMAPIGFTGKVKKGHKTKQRRVRGDEAVAEVHVDGAFYWRFQEYGTQGHAEQPFIRPAVQQVIPDPADAFREQFGKQLEKAIKRAAKKAAKSGGA